MCATIMSSGSRRGAMMATLSCDHPPDRPPSATAVQTLPALGQTVVGEICPKCQNPTLYHQEGCATCGSCGYSNCE